MLNSANLTLIGFARHVGQTDGQVAALAVMAVAASEGGRRTRAHHRALQGNVELERRQAHDAAGLT